MRIDPYRPLFFLGLLSGVLGVSLWLIFFAGMVASPMLTHAYIMICGFFLAFVSGFLMTALPRMSATTPATVIEQSLAFGLVAAGVISALFGEFRVAYTLAFLQFLFLMAFAVRRIFQRQQNPPIGFIFIPTALLWGACGAFLQAGIFWGLPITSKGQEFARVALQEAFLLNLIVGLGGRLIPFLTRVQQVSPMIARPDPWRPIGIIHPLLNLSFALEGFGIWRSAWGLRALVLAMAAIRLFKLHLPPQQRGFLGAGLRLSVTMMVIGFALLALLPGYRLALLHFVFIGGFTLMTIMVSTRVILSHGGFSLDLERNSKVIAGAALLLLSAAFLRSFYFLPLAATFWLAAVVIWFQGIGRLVFK